MTWLHFRNRWLLEDLLMPAAGLLLLNSFLPWYAVHWSTLHLDTDRTTTHSTTASAWSSSTGWSVGILLSLASVAAWMIQKPRLGPPQPARHASATLAVAAVVITAATWAAIPPTTTATGQALAFQPLPPGGTALGLITRDALTDGQTNVSISFYVGIALMILIAYTLCVADRRASTASIGA